MPLKIYGKLNLEERFKDRSPISLLLVSFQSELPASQSVCAESVAYAGERNAQFAHLSGDEKKMTRK